MYTTIIKHLWVRAEEGLDGVRPSQMNSRKQLEDGAPQTERMFYFGGGVLYIDVYYYY